MALCDVAHTICQAQPGGVCAVRLAEAVSTGDQRDLCRGRVDRMAGDVRFRLIGSGRMAGDGGGWRGVAGLVGGGGRC